jgi:peptide/nickel transport system ATP-binding protein
MAEKNADILLKVENLSVEYHTDEAVFHAVNNISLELNRGETLGLVGETGAGKTTTALSIIRLLPSRVGFAKGHIFLNGVDVLALPETKMQRLRGNDVSMIFQDPMTSLNPVMTVEEQISEVLEAHSVMTAKEISNRVDEMLTLVGIQPVRKSDYPNQFSGGMKQRVVIAMALACESELLIADEPTTALDVTIQAQVLAMMDELKQKLRTSMLLITHDLGIVATICDKVAIMYAGEIIENGSLEDIYDGDEHHPYTVGLFGSIPNMSRKTRRLSPINGLMPDSSDLPAGCKFHDRCPHAQNLCETEEPGVYVNGGHYIRCHRYTGRIPVT